MNTATLRNLILASLCVLLAAGGFSFMILKIKNKEGELKTQLQALNEENLRENSFYKLQKTAEESASDREQLATYFLKQESDSITVLNLIEGMAPKANVHLETKSLQKITDKDSKTNWIEVALVFSGEQHDVERFVGILERLPYLSYLTSLSMSAQKSNSWEANATLRIYLFSYDK